MPFKKTEVRFKLLTDLTKAIKEAQKAGVQNPVKMLKRALRARIEYKVWKGSKKK